MSKCPECGGRGWIVVNQDYYNPAGEQEPCQRCEEMKEHAIAFFTWWWNQPGTNTEQGYDEWVKTL